MTVSGLDTSRWRARGLILAAVLSLVAVLSAPVDGRADIIAVSGQVEVLAHPPSSVANDTLVNNDFLRLYIEQQRLLSTVPIAVDFVLPGLYDEFTDLPRPRPLLPAGLLIDSYLLHTDQDNREGGGSRYEVSVTFDTDILGVMVRSSTFDMLVDATDGPLGALVTTYPVGREGRGLEFRIDREWVELSPDLRTLSLEVGTFFALDEVRVITAASASEVSTVDGPPPLVLVVLAGMGVGLARARHCALRRLHRGRPRG